jgi:hypothetical protein
VDRFIIVGRKYSTTTSIDLYETRNTTTFDGKIITKDIEENRRTKGTGTPQRERERTK